jgi:hypothetical protein
MNAPRATPSPAELANEINNEFVALGLVSMPLLPFALPALLLAAPFALVAVAGLLPLGILFLPLWLGRMVRRRLRR